MRGRSSRERYRAFVEEYKKHNLDECGLQQTTKPQTGGGKTKRREYLREYLRWLWPYRYGAGALFVLALVGAGLQMVEPLFMRYIVDRVLLVSGLDAATRVSRLNFAGTLFLALILVSNL